MLHFAGILLALTCALANANHLRPILEKCVLSNVNSTFIADNAMLECKNDDNGLLITVNGDLKVQLDMDQVDVTVQGYAWENNDYVIRPNAKLTMGICKEYKMQSIGNWQEIAKYGNLVGCGVLEPGNYHTKDFPPKIKIPNVKVPAGKFRVHARAHIGEVTLYELDFYAELKD